MPTEITQDEQTAAKHLADAVNLHVSAVLAGGTRTRPGYVVIRLVDGKSPDGVLYDSRADAVRHNKYDPAACYIRVGRDTMPFKEALIVLQMHRRAYKAGVVFAEEEIITPQLTELMAPFIPRTLRNLR